MGCNAWNHSPGCDCGWGGQGNPSNLHHGEVFKNFSFSNQNKNNGANSYSFSWLYEGSITFSTFCWWCGQEVYFHRNENGGCVLFDELGVPWQVHACWESNKHQHSIVINDLLERHKEKLNNIRLKDYKFHTDYLNLIDFAGFLLGYDPTIQIISSITQYNIATHYYCFLVFKTEDGKYLRILVSKKSIEKALKFSYAKIKIHQLIRNNRYIYELDEISSLKLNASDNNIVKNECSIKDFLNESWTWQLLEKTRTK